MTLLLAVTALALAACGSDKKTEAAVNAGADTTTATSTSPTTPASDPNDPAAQCKDVQLPAPKSPNVPKPKGKLDPNKTYVVVMKTSCGELRIKLDQRNNPKTANAFASLVRANYYDGTGFHRVVKDWVVQGGDPKGDGSGGPKWQVVEAPPKNAKYSRGVVAMAKTATDPDGASGSQFFIVVGEDAGLPPQYAIAGKLKTGRKVVDAMSALGAPGADGPPARPVVIERAYLDVK